MMGEVGLGGGLVDHKPLYGRVRDLVLNRIRSGDWGPGQSLPNEIVLATDFGVSVGTIRRAIEGLERNGVVSRKQGRGTFVTNTGHDLLNPPECPLKVVKRGVGAVVYEKLNMERRRLTNSELLKFKLQRGGEVLETSSLLRLGTRPVGHELSLIPFQKLPRADIHYSSIAEVRGLLNNRGVVAKWAEDAVGLTVATDGLRKLLPADQPLLEFQRTTFIAEGDLIEHRTIEFLSSDLQYVSRHS